MPVPTRITCLVSGIPLNLHFPLASWVGGRSKLTALPLNFKLSLRDDDWHHCSVLAELNKQGWHPTLTSDPIFEEDQLSHQFVWCDFLKLPCPFSFRVQFRGNKSVMSAPLEDQPNASSFLWYSVFLPGTCDPQQPTYLQSKTHAFHHAQSEVHGRIVQRRIFSENTADTTGKQEPSTSRMWHSYSSDPNFPQNTPFRVDFTQAEST